MSRSYTIARLAAAAGVHVETIRYYQRRRLVPEPPRPAGGVRRYTEADAERLRFIKRAQAMGAAVARHASALRIDQHDVQFRARSTTHAAIVNDEAQEPVACLAHLTAILYQVRNNLVHGDKDLVSPRDRRLVRACPGILDELLPALESCIEKRARS